MSNIVYDKIFSYVDQTKREKIALINTQGHSITYDVLVKTSVKISGYILAHLKNLDDPSILISTGSKVIDAVLALSCMLSGIRFTIIDRQKDDIHKAYVCRHSDATILIVGDEEDCTPWVSSNVIHIWRAGYSENKIKLIGPSLKANNDPLFPPIIHGETPQAIFYTSGSTGNPKGVVVSLSQLLDGADTVTKYLNMNSSDTVLSYLPISFDYGFNQIMNTLTVGATVILEDEFKPLKIRSVCSQYEPTILPGSPSIFLKLGKLIKRRPDDIGDFASIRTVTNTGGRIPEVGHSFIQAIKSRFGVKPYLMYGLTECFRSSFLPPELYSEKHNAIGRAVPGVSLHLQDESGNIITTPNTIGEILHSGRLISYGYYKDPSATNLLFTHLTHLSFKNISNPPQAVKSGDLGWFDNDGIFFHAGRKDNLIKVREQRTSLDMIENSIAKTGLFDVSAVIGDEDRDGLPIIHIVGTPSSLVQKETLEIRRQLLEALPNYLASFKLTLLSELPTNTNGKICKKTLVTKLKTTKGQQ
ncbi:AMP-binding protein [Vibrio sp.]|nr:AMP-binding protein [Vibrio sp.]